MTTPSIVPPVEIDDTVPMLIEQITPRLKRIWLLDKQIVLYKGIDDVSRETIDDWIECVKETKEHWPKGQPYLVIHDLSGDKVWLTPYARKRVEEIATVNPGIPGFIALILPRTVISHVVRLYLRQHKNLANENQIFFTMKDAMSWLKPKIKQVEPLNVTNKIAAEQSTPIPPAPPAP